MILFCVKCKKLTVHLMSNDKYKCKECGTERS